MTPLADFRNEPLLVSFGVALGVLTIGVLFSSHYIPSVDLPQHAVQLSAWAHYADPAYGFAPQFELNYRTPYLLCYLLARPFAITLGPVVALKLVLLLAAFANVLALGALLRCSEQDVWLALLGFPLTFGFSYYAGFLNHVLAAPLAIAALAVSTEYAHLPTRGRALALCALLIATCLCHAFAFAVCAPVSLLVYAGESTGNPRSRPRHYWPFAMATIVSAPWLLGLYGLAGGIDASHQASSWDLDAQRVWAFPGMLLGAGLVDPLAIAFGLLTMLIVGCSLSLPIWSWHRMSLYAVAWLAYLLGPFRLFGVPFIFQRFAVLVVPGAILSSGIEAPFWSMRTRRTWVVLLSAAWLTILGERAKAFNLKSRELDIALSDLTCPRLRPLIIDKTTSAFPELPVYVHFPAYFQAEHGGYYGFSFASDNSLLVRYRSGIDRGMPKDAEWNPESFDPVREHNLYDCVVARSSPDQAPAVLQQAVQRGLLKPYSHAGSFWVYRTSSPH